MLLVSLLRENAVEFLKMRRVTLTLQLLSVNKLISFDMVGYVSAHSCAFIRPFHKVKMAVYIVVYLYLVITGWVCLSLIHVMWWGCRNL